MFKYLKRKHATKCMSISNKRKQYTRPNYHRKSDIIHSVDIEELLANSDHNSVRIEMRIPVKRVNEYTRTIYLCSKGDYENMNEELDHISLNKYDPNRDVDTNWRHFREVYQVLIDKYVPIQVIKVGLRFKAPWMKDSQAKRSKKTKRKLWLKYKTSGLNTDT